MKHFLTETLFLVNKNKNKIPFILFLFFISAFFDLLGVGIMIPYIQIVTNVDEFIVNHQYLKDYLILDGSENVLLFVFSIIILIIFVIKTFFILIIQKEIIKFGEEHKADLQVLLIKKFQHLKYEDYISRNSSEYIQMITKFTGDFTDYVLTPILKMTSDTIVTVLILTFLVYHNPIALLSVTIILIILVILFDKVYRNKMNTYGLNSIRAEKKLLKLISENVDGFKQIRVFNRENYFFDNFTRNAYLYAKNHIKHRFYSTIPRYILEFIMVIFIVSFVLLTILFGGNLNTILPTLAAFGVAAIRLFPALSNFSASLMRIRYARPGVTKLYNELFDENDLRKENLYKKNLIKKKKFSRLNLSNVLYAYPNTKIDVIKNVSLEIKKGETIGIMGPSGSGKSTLIDVILGFLIPKKGKILLNGSNLFNQIHQWNEMVAYLPQSNFLIDDTILNNITLGDNNIDLEDPKLLEIIKMARLDEVLKKTSNGLETLVGERGIMLSGGQKQRIAIARALFFERDVLILDESTSALDEKTENDIIDSIKDIKGRVTTIIIAHRKSTLRYCDKIFNLNNGKIKRV